MKKQLTILLMLLAPLTRAQTHLVGQRFLQVGAGSYDRLIPGPDNFNVRVGLGKYTARGWESTFFLTGAQKETSLVESGTGTGLGQNIPVEQYAGGYQLAFPLYRSAMKTFLVKLPLSAQIGYERINRGLPYATGYAAGPGSRMLLGVGGAVEVEIWGVLLGVRQQVNFLSRYEKLSTWPYLGYKIHFYR